MMNGGQKHYDLIGLLLLLIYGLGVLNMVYFNNSIIGLYLVLALTSIGIGYVVVMLIIFTIRTFIIKNKE